MNLFGDDDTNQDDDVFIEKAEAIAALRPPQQSTLLLGHAEVEAHIFSLLRAGRLPHGIICAGPKGVGKATFAFALARFMLAGGQGQTLTLPASHPVARRVAAGGEPDLLTIDRLENKESLGVEVVRTITTFLHRTASTTGGWRVVIVDDADTMTRAAQNGILKVLEEPPARALLILVAHRLEALLPTVRSRAHVIHFTPLETSVLREIIGTCIDVPFFKELAAGSASRALAYRDNGALEIWERLQPLLPPAPSDWRTIHALAESFNGKNAKAQYETFADIILWHYGTLVRTTVRTTPHATQHMETYDALVEHFSRVKQGSLDMRYGVLGAFMIIYGQ